MTTHDPKTPPSGGGLFAGWRLSRGWTEALWTLATMVLSVLVAVWVLALWRGSLGLPLSNQADLLLALSAIKGMLENGWYLYNPSLGAPAGQDLADFSGLNGDSLTWVILRVIGFVVSDPVTLLNTVFILSFALAGGVAYLVLRDFGIRHTTAMALGVVYANISFHFTHGAAHIALSMYYLVPAAIWIVLRVAMGERLLNMRPATGPRRFITPRNIGVALSVVAIGGSTVYYGFFTLLLVALAALLRALSTRSWRSVLPGAIAFVAISFVLLLNLLPGIAYRIANGPNPELATRIPYESALYSFDLTRLVFMVAGHRIERLSNFGNKIAGNSLTIGEGDVLGLVIGGTFLVMLLILGIWLVRGRGSSGRSGALLNASILMGLAVFLIGTTGGFGFMIANFISPQIRSWTRLTPFLAFLCLIVLSIGIDWVRRKVDGNGWRQLASVALPIFIAGFTIWNGTSPTNRPDYAGLEAAWKTERQFADGVSATVPPGSAVLQMPLVSFPESGSTEQMGDYEHLTGYILTDGLRWSFGAMRGRPSDWTAVAADLPAATLIPAAAVAGFDGVWIDRAGYADRGARLETEVQKATALSRPTVASPDGRRVFYDLRALRARLDKSLTPAEQADIATALIRPVNAQYGAGFYGLEENEDERWRWAANEALMTIRNPTGRTQDVQWSAVLRAAGGSTVRISSGQRELAAANFVTLDDKRPVTLSLKVPPEGMTVRFQTIGGNLGPDLGDSRPLFLKVTNPTLVTDELSDAVKALR